MSQRRHSKSKRNSQVREVWRRFRKSKTAMIGLVMLVAILGIAIFADVIVSYESAITQTSDERLQKPNIHHLLGTDYLGRDMFARVCHGSRYSLMIGISTSLLALIIGGFLGAAAGYFGGVIDNIIMRAMDVFMSVPPVLLSLAVVAALGPNLRNLLIAITVSCVPGTVRLIRSVVLTVVEQDYIEAARSYNSTDIRIILKHVLPNAIGPIIVNTTMNIAAMILSAAITPPL